MAQDGIHDIVWANTIISRNSGSEIASVVAVRHFAGTATIKALYVITNAMSLFSTFMMFNSVVNHNLHIIRSTMHVKDILSPGRLLL
jgi:hypothetical protein